MASVPPDDIVARWREATRTELADKPAALQEEVAVHLADRWMHLRESGLSDDAADRRVRAELIEWRHAPVPRRRFAVGLLGIGWPAELRRTIRGLGRRPLYSGAMVLLATIAIGANVAAFAIAYGLVGRPLPYPDNDRLAVLWCVQKGETGQISYPDFVDLTAGSLFDGAAAMSGGRGSLRVGDRIERVEGLEIEPQGLLLLGARPSLGRLLDANDRGGPAVMISHRLWSTHLGADPAIIGRALWLSGRTLTVVGVLEPGFDFELPIGTTFKLERIDIWSILAPAPPVSTRRDVHTFETLVRLRRDLSLGRTQAEVDTIGRRLAAAHVNTNKDKSFRLAPLKAEIVAPFKHSLVMIIAAALITLGIAIANLLTLTTIRLADRRGELAVCQALGAGAYRLRRQLMSEHLVVIGLGAIAGFLLASTLIAAALNLQAADLPRPDAIQLDWPVQLFGICLSGALVAILACVPHGPRDPASVLRVGGRAVRQGRTFRKVLVASQLALALTLAASAALIGLGLTRLLGVDRGFESRGLISLRVSAYAARYPDLPSVVGFVDSVVARLETLPAVSRVGAGSSLPLSGQTTGTSVAAEGSAPVSASRLSAGWQFVSPGYFDALGVRLRAGRDFRPEDRTHDGHVTVINDTLAQALFPGGQAVGRRIAVGGGDSAGDWHEVIGVVADVRHQGLGTAPLPRVYDLFGEHWGRTLYIAARTGLDDPSPLLDSARRAIAALDPEAPVFETATMDELVTRSAAPHRLALIVAGGLTITALLLVVAGVYAVAASTVVERTQEVGIRAALGASPNYLMGLVLRDVVRTAGAGAIAGSLCAVAAGQALVAQVFGIRGTDAVLTVPVLAVLVVIVAALAALPPARTAARIDPLRAMRLP